MIDQIKQRDVLLSYPYENIKTFIRLLNEASYDDSVVSIKITLYRVAKHSQIIDALVNSAENGKNVLVLVELRARFDEENNIGWSKRLEEAGCTVIYGPKNIKVHSKLLLITRKTEQGTEYITQVGTGNYNEKTSTLYTDLSLMTANLEIGLEALNVFNSLSLGHLVEDTTHLLVAPNCLQNKVIDMIDDEIALAKLGQPAYIGIKINSLSDKKIILKLVEASQSGVKVDLVIRGICCLISGVKDKTENIHVRSIVGRFLEHSRIYIFGTPERSKVYISSADYMTRNTVRRVEVAVPIYDVDIKKRLLDMFNIMLADNVQARVQQPDGSYKRVKTEGKAINSQEYFFAQAY
jgi:polyphosphate kinase